jgi:acyl-CoA synthetase (AMP-forming)/AMP-acid ligase II
MMPYRTLAQAIPAIGALHPTRGFVFQDQKGVETSFSFADIDAQTAVRAAALQELGLRKGDRFGLIVVEPEDFVLTFLAALRVGILPVPLYPPLSFGSLDAYAERTARVLESAGVTALIASGQLENVLWGLVDRVSTLGRLVRVEDLRTARGVATWPVISPDDLAFLQYTSGSTSEPKGVMVTHGNLCANGAVIIAGLGLRPEAGSKGVSWLPLYHDMGLIGFVIAPLLHGIPIVFIPTMRFIRKPSVWLETIHAHRATSSFAPNFAYALVAKKVKAEELARWDLSCVEVFGCGAEPIHAGTVRSFLDTVGTPTGVKDTAFLPAYGMAESTLCIAFKPEGERMVTRRVDAERFQADGQALEVEQADGGVLEHVSCGRAFPGHEIGIFTEQGERLTDDREGEICVRGPSVCPGYWQDEAATARTFRGDWLRTGDLGYLHDGHVYVTGRLKDLIILNGRNVHPQAVEWAAAEIDGVRKGNVVAFSQPGPHSEELIVALETKSEDLDTLREAVRAAVQRELGMTVADVVCLEPGTLPKTSSGKLQRRRTRDLYLTGQLGAQGSRLPGAAADRLTLVRHVARSMWSRAKASFRPAVSP